MSSGILTVVFPTVAYTVSNDSSIPEEICLHIDTTTWARDSHELFDYEARHVYKQSYYLKHASRVFRTTVEIKVIPEGAPPPIQAADYLLSVRYRDGQFLVVPADKYLASSDSVPIFSKRLWLIVKDLPTGKHYMREGDIIKLGRFKLRVKQLVKDGASKPELKMIHTEAPELIMSSEEMSSMQCRICLWEGSLPGDPLVCPCQCKGSIKYVHVGCLKHWINGNASEIVDDMQKKTTYFFKQSLCELCKTAIPTFFKVNSECYTIIKLPQIKPPFLILENLVGNGNHGVYVISLEHGKESKLGRGHESDVRIADVSISRCHATICFSNGEFVLQDHNSKFGTLVSLRRVHVIDQTQPLTVQVGRTIMSMSLRPFPSNKFEDCIAVDEGCFTREQESTKVENLAPNILSEQQMNMSSEESYHAITCSREQISASVTSQSVEDGAYFQNHMCEQPGGLEDLCGQYIPVNTFENEKQVNGATISSNSNVRRSVQVVTNITYEPCVIPETAVCEDKLEPISLEADDIKHDSELASGSQNNELALPDERAHQMIPSSETLPVTTFDECFSRERLLSRSLPPDYFHRFRQPTTSQNDSESSHYSALAECSNLPNINFHLPRPTFFQPFHRRPFHQIHLKRKRTTSLPEQNAPIYFHDLLMNQKLEENTPVQEHLHYDSLQRPVILPHQDAHQSPRARSSHFP